MINLDANKAIVRRHFDEIWNQRRLDIAEQIVDPAYLSHFPLPGQPAGIAGFRYAVEMLQSSFPDLVMTIEELIAEGDKVVARMTARGTHQGVFHGIAPTGRAVSWAGIRIFRIADGKIVEHWANWDDLSLLQQLGGRIEH
jgi:steroid delta-isomerase-like uncharacterized protein